MEEKKRGCFIGRKLARFRAIDDGINRSDGGKEGTCVLMTRNENITSMPLGVGKGLRPNSEGMSSTGEMDFSKTKSKGQRSLETGNEHSTSEGASPTVISTMRRADVGQKSLVIAVVGTTYC